MPAPGSDCLDYSIEDSEVVSGSSGEDSSVMDVGGMNDAMHAYVCI